MKRMNIKDREQLAVVVNDVKWIKDAVRSMNKKLDTHISWGERQNDKIENHFAVHDKRIQRLENGIKNRKSAKQESKEERDYKLALIALIISTAINILSLLLR